jgi:peptidoglycan/xylan/chitin deacetylase (PgdA/CDA1 family)
MVKGKPKNAIPVHISLLLTAVLAAFVFFAVYARRHQQSLPMVENKASEQRELPPEIAHAVRLAQLDRRYRVPILLYHYVEYVKDHRDLIRKSLDTRPDIFEAQVKTLQDAGYTFLTVSELSGILDARQEMPEKPVALTFDDGYLDFYTDVFPILSVYRVKATAYISPGLLNGENYMNDRHIQEIAESGLVEIGAHTVHHVPLAGAPSELVEQEVYGSKQQLEQRFGLTVTSFAYPYGSFDGQAVRVVKEAGFTTSVSTVEGTELHQTNRLFLYRIRAGNLVGEGLIRFLNSPAGVP